MSRPLFGIAALAWLGVACHSVDVVQRGEGGSPAKEPSRCAPYADKESCCSAECFWLDPSGSFEGRCFDETENCGTRSDCFEGSAECCGSMGFCYGGDLLGEYSTCKPNYTISGQFFAVCVDECPVGPPHPDYKELCVPIGPQ